MRVQIKQGADEMPNWNVSTTVWLSYKNAGLTTLQPFAQFETLNITMLSLDHNRLVYIPPKVLSRLRQLTIVSASHNDIGSVAPDAFKGLRELRHVDLSYNSLYTLDFRLVLDAASLVSFDVHNNSIKSVITPNAKMPSLETLDVSANNITEFPSSFFSSFSNLLKLNISYNNLRTVTNDLFQELAALKILDASGNRIKSIDGKGLQHLASLNKLYLSNNRLSGLDFVEVLPKVNTLDVSNNRLSFLGERPLSSSVQRLVVSHNRLANLSHVFKVFDSLKVHRIIRMTVCLVMYLIYRGLKIYPWHLLPHKVLIEWIKIICIEVCMIFGQFNGDSDL